MLYVMISVICVFILYPLITKKQIIERTSKIMQTKTALSTAENFNMSEYKITQKTSQMPSCSQEQPIISAQKFDIKNTQQTQVENHRNRLNTTESLDESQRKAINAVLRGDPLVLISGAAGTGKSFVIRIIERELSELGKNVMLLAPTGMAAINIGGETIHSAFRMPLSVNPIDEMTEQHYLQNNHKLKEKLKYIDTIIIDEISMVRADIMQTICDILEYYGPHLDQDLGGVQLVMVGDLLQLPPVLARGEETTAFEEVGYSPERPYFFECLAIGSSEITSTPLTKNYRQQDSDDDISLLFCLNSIRQDVGERIEGVEECINSYCNEPDGTQTVTLCATNDIADKINDNELSNIPGEAVPFIAYIDDRRKNKHTEDYSTFPSPEILWLKPGSKVMITKNLYGTNNKKEFIPNGAMAEVLSLRENFIGIELTTIQPGRKFTVPKVTWESYRYKYNKNQHRIEKEVVISFTQYPLRPAWAITIHKSQGMTLENYAINLRNSDFAANLAYVALSRARTFEDIHLIEKLKNTDIKFDPYMMFMNYIFEKEETVCPDDWKIRGIQFAKEYA